MLLLGLYLQGAAPRPPCPKAPVCVKSPPTPLADVGNPRIARWNRKHINTGFKWIQRQIILPGWRRLQAGWERFIFGFEESYGYLAEERMYVTRIPSVKHHAHLRNGDLLPQRLVKTSRREELGACIT